MASYYDKLTQMVRRLVDKSLSKHNKTYDDVVNNPVVDGQDWFQAYTLTESEQKDFEKWAIEELKSEMKCSKKEAKRIFMNYDMNWGLKTENKNQNK